MKKLKLYIFYTTSGEPYEYGYGIYSVSAYSSREANSLLQKLLTKQFCNEKIVKFERIKTGTRSVKLLQAPVHE